MTGVFMSFNYGKFQDISFCVNAVIFVPVNFFYLFLFFILILCYTTK